MIWITGDTHGSFAWLERFCREKNTSCGDVMIILGDACINYFGPSRDDALKRMLSALPITLLCVHGNHEMRPQHLCSYALRPWRGGMVWQEELFPTLLFARDGEVYDLDGVETLVVGGAYSPDKLRRVALGWGWWPDEQPDAAVRAKAEGALAERQWRIGAVLSHTCPERYLPVEAFLPGVDQRSVDRSTEEWLDGVEARLSYRRWFCGHFHTDKELQTGDDGRRICFMMHAVRAWREANGLEDAEAWDRLSMR